MDIWFTADSHFTHKNIIAYESRPYRDTEHMDEQLIDTWNASIKENDLIFHLGDLFFGNKEKQFNISEKLKGRKILILGNHDKLSKKRYMDLGFSPFQQYIYEDYLLTHSPQQETPLQSLIANTHVKGNIHGHIHSKKMDNQSIYLCVSIEHGYKPFHIDEVREHFKK
ncbi:metallophosphoesterase family protein [Priestia filamentosa]|uniref:metallophosphoesterase family protein n=1 Tax=Priestia filamentosa TaxID=1402861 RepID=UPI00397818E4